MTISAFPAQPHDLPATLNERLACLGVVGINAAALIRRRIATDPAFAKPTEPAYDENPERPEDPRWVDRNARDGRPADEVAATLSELADANADAIATSASVHRVAGTDDRLRAVQGEGRAAEYGAPQMRIDVDLTSFIAEAVGKLLPRLFAAGEESTQTEWRYVMDLPAGNGWALIDPLDGSRNAATTGLNWAVILLLIDVTERGREVRGGVVVTSDDKVITFNVEECTVTMRAHLIEATLAADGTVDHFVNTIEADLADPARPRRSGDIHTLSTIGLTATARQRIAPFMATTGGGFGLPPLPRAGQDPQNNPGFSVNCFGGAPLMVQMAIGGVRWCIQGDWTTAFDAVGVLIMALIPGRFEFYRLDIRGEDWKKRKVDEETVRGWFTDIKAPSEDAKTGPGTYKPIPPLLICEADGGDGGDRVTVYVNGEVDEDRTAAATATIRQRILDAWDAKRPSDRLVVERQQPLQVMGTSSYMPPLDD
jgi:hypothetical protein